MNFSFRAAIILTAALGVAALAPAQDRWGQYGPGDRYGYGDGYGYDRGYGDGQRGDSPAYGAGFEDGQRDGSHDAYTGHSFRPTHSGNYHHADHGYHHDFGPRQFYKDQYRAGYMEGYRAGYGNGGYYRGRRW